MVFWRYLKAKTALTRCGYCDRIFFKYANGIVFLGVYIMNTTTTKATSLLSLPLLCAFFAMPVFTALADNVTWTGGANDGKWETGDNWNTHAMPTDSDVAVFPDVDTTVTITDAVKAQYVRTAGTSDATITLTGPGSLEITSDVFAQTTWTSANFIYDVNVIATPIGETRWISLYRNNVYEKSVDASTHKLCLRTDSVCSLAGDADVTAKYVNMYGSSDSNRYLNNSLIISGNSKLTVTGGEAITLMSGATFSVSDNARVNLANDLIAYPGASLTISGNPVINLRKLFLPFSYAEGTDEEWTMGGGEILAMHNSSDYRLEMPYTNATKTISGTGTFCMYRFGLDSATNLVFRLNGPNAYFRKPSASTSQNLRFEVGGGSTVGAWGDNASFNVWTNRIVGAATVDTTDYSDKTTPRTITLGKYYDCNGILTVKGVGTCALGGIEQPNLGLAGTDSSTMTCSSAYALGDIVLNDSSKLTATGYLGHKGEESYRNVKSLTMDGNSSLDIGRYIIVSGDAMLSGSAAAVIRNANNEKSVGFTCANLSLADSASLVVTGSVYTTAISLSDCASLSVTGMIAAASLAMSGDAHLAFTAGTAFEAGAAFGAGNWTMEITIPSGYEAGIHPVVKGADFGGDFAEHVTLLGDTTGWSARTIDGNLVLYKESTPSGIEWIGKSTTSDNWSDVANWNGGNVPTVDDIVAFGGLARPTPYKDTEGSVSGLVFRVSAGPFTLTGSGDLKPTADCGSRSKASAANAAIASHSAFDQTISQFVDFGSHHVYLLSDGGGALKLTDGFTATGDWNYFIIGGDVRIGGTCSVGIFSFRTSTTTTPSCLRILSGGTFTSRNQYFRGLVEQDIYIGRLVVEDGGTMVVQNGDCVFWYGGLENVINGTLVVKGTGGENGRLVGAPSEQYYSGNGVIYADSARSGRKPAVADHYINIGGTLKLYMNGDWYTATYRWNNSEGVMQDPNYPTRFRMKDGTTLGATADWTYGPAADASDVIAVTNTPADRASIMVGAVTVNTQNPTNDTAHTITFVDPLDASAANLVKVGAGTLAFNEPAGYPSQISNLTVNAGVVRFTGAAPTVDNITANAGTVRFAAAPALSGSLTIASTDAKFCVDGAAETMAWELLATAADIVGPNDETKWRAANGMRRFKIVSEGTVKALYGATASGFTAVLR